jgi:hypothetical protein
VIRYEEVIRKKLYEQALLLRKNGSTDFDGDMRSFAQNLVTETILPDIEGPLNVAFEAAVNSGLNPVDASSAVSDDAERRRGNKARYNAIASARKVRGQTEMIGALEEWPLGEDATRHAGSALEFFATGAHQRTVSNPLDAPGRSLISNEDTRDRSERAVLAAIDSIKNDPSLKSAHEERNQAVFDVFRLQGNHVRWQSVLGREARSFISEGLGPNNRRVTINLSEVEDLHPETTLWVEDHADLEDLFSDDKRLIEFAKGIGLIVNATESIDGGLQDPLLAKDRTDGKPGQLDALLYSQKILLELR